MRRIIAISGNGTGAGKTTFANKVGDQVFSIAGSLRGELSRVYPRYDWYRKDQDYKDTTLVHEWGPKATVRSVLTEYGQIKCQGNPEYWVKKLIEHLKEVERIADCTNTIAIDDVRKVCELDALRNVFGERVQHIHVVGKGAKEEKLFDNDELHALCDYEVMW